MGFNGSSSPQQRCHCAVDDLLAPLRSKMKVLKKIKRRIGLTILQYRSAEYRRLQCSGIYVMLYLGEELGAASRQTSGSADVTFWQIKLLYRQII
ncbi:hypothetical protein J6590_061718 [Homalodisca vitripennis]|nr:hypothetical protein J6590_061718 [Homalodisca vitripennis]